MDAELLNKMIQIDENGNINARKEYLPLARKKCQRYLD